MDQTQPIIQYTTVSDSVYRPGTPHQNTWRQPHPGPRRNQTSGSRGTFDHETALWGSRVPALQGTSDGNLRHPYPDGAVLRRQNLYQGK